MKVRLLKPWHGEPIGKVVTLDRYVAAGLIRDSVATDLGNVDMRELPASLASDKMVRGEMVETK